jgi:hypothetical protein
MDQELGKIEVEGPDLGLLFVSSLEWCQYLVGQGVMPSWKSVCPSNRYLQWHKGISPSTWKMVHFFLSPKPAKMVGIHNQWAFLHQRASPYKE